MRRRTIGVSAADFAVIPLACKVFLATARLRGSVARRGYVPSMPQTIGAAFVELRGDPSKLDADAALAGAKAGEEAAGALKVEITAGAEKAGAVLTGTLSDAAGKAAEAIGIAAQDSAESLKVISRAAEREALQSVASADQLGAGFVEAAGAAREAITRIDDKGTWMLIQANAERTGAVIAESISAGSDKAKSSLGSLDRAASESNGFSAFKQHGINALQILGAGALGTVAGITYLGVTGAANLQTLTTWFTSLLGSSAKATQQIKALQKFAASTPFSQEDVLGYAQQFYSLSNSIGLAKTQVVPFLTTIGNIGAVTGASADNIHNAVMAIAQIGGTGKVTLDNLNQISNAFPGFNAAAAIAAGTGQTTAQVMQQISKGSLDAKTGVNALLTGMQKFPGAAGAMVAQSKTLAGAFSNFKDSAQIALTQAFTPLLPTLTRILDQLSPIIASTLGTLAPAITGFINTLLPLIAPLLQALGPVLASVLDAVGPAIGSLVPLVQPLAQALLQLIGAIGPLFPLAAQLIVQLGTPLLQLFGQLFTALAPVISSLAGALAPVLPIIGRALTQVFTALSPLIGALAGAFIQVIEALAPSLPQLATSLAQIALALATVLAAVAPLIGPLTTLLLKLFMPNITTIVRLTSVFASFAQALSGVVVGALHLLLSVFLNVVSGILHGAASAFGWVPGLGSKLKKARDDFDTFKNSVNASIARIAQVHETVARLHLDPATASAYERYMNQATRDRTVTMRVITVPGGRKAGFAVGGRPPTAVPSLVGEEGPEMFIPDTPGTIIPSVPTAAALLAAHNSKRSDTAAAGETTIIHNHWTINEVTDAIGTAQAVIRRQKMLVS